MKIFEEDNKLKIVVYDTSNCSGYGLTENGAKISNIYGISDEELQLIKTHKTALVSFPKFNYIDFYKLNLEIEEFYSFENDKIDYMYNLALSRIAGKLTNVEYLQKVTLEVKENE